MDGTALTTNKLKGPLNKYSIFKGPFCNINFQETLEIGRHLAFQAFNSHPQNVLLENKLINKKAINQELMLLNSREEENFMGHIHLER